MNGSEEEGGTDMRFDHLYKSKRFYLYNITLKINLFYYHFLSYSCRRYGCRKVLASFEIR